VAVREISKERFVAEMVSLRAAFEKTVQELTREDAPVPASGIHLSLVLHGGWAFSFAPRLALEPLALLRPSLASFRKGASIGCLHHEVESGQCLKENPATRRTAGRVPAPALWGERMLDFGAAGATLPRGPCSRGAAAALPTGVSRRGLGFN
jgi:hypothetical protein